MRNEQKTKRQRRPGQMMRKTKIAEAKNEEEIGKYEIWTENRAKECR